MNILITGGGGFLGQYLTKALLSSSELEVNRVVLVDIEMPKPLIRDARLFVRQGDVTRPDEARELFAEGIDVIFHLAAVVSGQAEENFDLGMRVNIDATRSLLEAART